MVPALGWWFGPGGGGGDGDGTVGVGWRWWCFVVVVVLLLLVVVVVLLVVVVLASVVVVVVFVVGGGLQDRIGPKSAFLWPARGKQAPRDHPGHDYGFRMPLSSGLDHKGMIMANYGFRMSL